MVDSESELEKVAKAYELISANNPPDLNSYLLVCSNNAEENLIKPFKSKLSEKEISDNLLWQKVIDDKKQEIAENILITAEKAKALSTKKTSEGKFYQFKGSEDWLDVNDYAETLLHQPFEDQLTHLFRFLLVNEFTNKEEVGDDYPLLDSLKNYYFNEDGGFPNKFFFAKALHENFTLFIWEKKEWLRLDHAKNHDDSISLKKLIDSGVLKEKFKNKIYFDGFTQSLAESIFDSIKNFTNPFAEYGQMAAILSLFKNMISFTLILEKLETLGYKNKNFILELISKEKSKYYIKHAELVLRKQLEKIHERNFQSKGLEELIRLSGENNKETLNELGDIEDARILAGLSWLIKELDSGRQISQETTSINENMEEDILGAYKAFLPWWHVVSSLTLEETNFAKIKSSLTESFKNTLSDGDQEWLNYFDACFSGQVQMKLLDQYDCMKLPSLALNTPLELVEERKKQKAWHEIDMIITGAYQHKISRAALSIQLSKVIKRNHPHLDKASRRLEQLLDLYENNIINN